jgi:hypothetical protein
MILSPNNKVGTTLRDASLLCLADKIVEAIQRAPESPIREHTIQTRHREQKQQHQDEDSEDNLDQGKRPPISHRRSYLMRNKSQGR